MLPVHIDMEKHYYPQNNGLAFAPAFTDRDKQLFMLYYDICDYFGWSTGQGEQVVPNRNDSSKDLDYLLAISG
jgi:hypothetical protein